jgi:hypothetical protein
MNTRQCDPLTVLREASMAAVFVFVALVTGQSGTAQAQDAANPVFFTNDDGEIDADGTWHMSYVAPDGRKLFGEAAVAGRDVRMEWKKGSLGQRTFDFQTAGFSDLNTTTALLESPDEVVFQRPEFIEALSANGYQYYLDGKLISHEEAAERAKEIHTSSLGLANLVLSLIGPEERAKNPGVPVGYQVRTYENGVYSPEKNMVVASAPLSIRYDGLTLRLFNAETSEDGRTIRWDWEAQAGINADYGPIWRASGSKEAGNPIVWGAAPELIGVLALNDQTFQHPKTGKALYLNPGPGGEALFADIEDEDYPFIEKKQRFQRRLIVLGKNMEPWEGLVPQSSSGALKYGALASTSPALSGKENRLRSFLNELDQLKPTVPFLTLRGAKSPSYSASEDTLDRIYQIKRSDPNVMVYVVDVDIEAPISPQPVTLSIDGQQATWPLLFGDRNADIRILRTGVPARDRFETTVHADIKQTSHTDPNRTIATLEETASPIFFRDEVVFEAELDFDHAADDVLIVLQDAAADEGLGPQRLKNISLKRDAENPRIYRSQTFLVARSDQENLDLAARDTYADIPAQKTLWLRKQSIVRPRTTELITGRPLADALVKEPLGAEGDFINALTRASQCFANGSARLPDPMDAGTEFRIARKKGNPVYTSSIGLFRPTEVTYGQLAALIMMRDRYVALAEPVLDDLKSFHAQPDLDDRLAAVQKAAMEGRRSVLSEVLELVPSRRTGDHALTTKTGLIRSSDIAFPTGADVGRNIKDVITELSRSLQVARQAGDCDAETLLSLTSRGFEPIARMLAAEVTRTEVSLRDGIKRVRPDLVARREFQAVWALHRRYKADLEVVNRRWSWFKTGTSVAAIVATLGASSAVTATGYALSAGGAATLEGFDAISTCYEHWCGAQADRQKLDFARGASHLFGKDYLKAVEAETTSPLFRATESLIQAVGGVAALNDFRQAANTWLILREAAQLSDAVSVLNRGSKLDEILGSAETVSNELFANADDLVGALGALPKDRAAQLSRFLALPEELLTDTQKLTRQALNQVVGQIGGDAAQRILKGSEDFAKTLREAQSFGDVARIEASTADAVKRVIENPLKLINKPLTPEEYDAVSKILAIPDEALSAPMKAAKSRISKIFTETRESAQWNALVSKVNVFEEANKGAIGVWNNAARAADAYDVQGIAKQTVQGAQQNRQKPQFPNADVAGPVPQVPSLKNVFEIPSDDGITLNNSDLAVEPITPFAVPESELYAPPEGK